jgi:competence ComEA-like helix-hairpin-helix protein
VSAFALCLSACATLPRHTSSEAQSPLNPPKAEGAAPLNINVATASELEKLPGVGKVIAERIIIYRTKYGPFRRAEHLMMVNGISESKFREIRPLIAVE